MAIEGDTAAVGASHDDHVGANNEGSAYVFTRSGTVWTQQQRLFAGDAAPDDFFAGSVAISGDTVVAGTWQDDHAGGTDAGSAYVFVRSGNTWSQQQKLVAADAAPDDRFGFSVEVDGDTAVVGAIWDDDIATDGGSAYVFTRSGGSWSQQQELVWDVGAGDLLGSAVAVSGDTIVVGAREDDVYGSSDGGSAMVYVRIGGVWSWHQGLRAVRPAGEANSGHSVAISSDTIAIGQKDWINGVPSNVGAAHIFVRSGDLWVQQHTYIKPGPSCCFFGRSVSVDGNTLAVGAPDEVVSESVDGGYATVLTRTGTSWGIQQDSLRGVDGTVENLFGWAVAIDGDTLVVGAPGDNPGGAGTAAGSAYVFVRSGVTWTQQAKLVASDAAGYDRFGRAVALDGDTVVIGSPEDHNAGGGVAGAAYVFIRSGTNWTQQSKLVADDAAWGDTFGSSVAVDGNTIVVGAPKEYAGGPAGAAYAFVRAGSAWGQQQRLSASDPNDFDRFGNAVSIRGDVAVIGSYRSDHAGSDAGAAWVFTRSGTSWTERQRIIGSDTVANDNFGFAVALDGGIIVAGAPWHAYPGEYAPGASYVFESDAPTLPFFDGFESGDTSGWSATVP